MNASMRINAIWSDGTTSWRTLHVFSSSWSYGLTFSKRLDFGQFSRMTRLCHACIWSSR